MEKIVYLVTGGSRGIGRSIAYKLASPDTVVAINHYDRDEVEADKTVAEIERLGATARKLYFDVSNIEETTHHIDSLVEEFGRIDGLVNNAGITMDAMFMRMKDTQWKTVLDVNLTGTYNCCKAVCKVMLKQRSGRIVNVSSLVGQIGNVGQVNYAASKAGVMALTKSLSKEFGPRGITVNAVAPGYIDNGDDRRSARERERGLSEIHPAGTGRHPGRRGRSGALSVVR